MEQSRIQAAESAISNYKSALVALDIYPGDYDFLITKTGRIKIGVRIPHTEDEFQWGMQEFTPEEFTRMAEMRRKDFPVVFHSK